MQAVPTTEVELYEPCYIKINTNNTSGSRPKRPVHLCAIGLETCVDGACIPLETAFESGTFPSSSSMEQDTTMMGAEMMPQQTTTFSTITSTSVLASFEAPVSLIPNPSPTSTFSISASPTSAAPIETSSTTSSCPAAITTHSPTCGMGAVVGSMIASAAWAGVIATAIVLMLCFRRTKKKSKVEGAVKERKIHDTNPPLVMKKAYLGSTEMFDPDFLNLKLSEHDRDVERHPRPPTERSKTAGPRRDMTARTGTSKTASTLYETGFYDYKTGPTRDNIDQWCRTAR